MQMRRVMLVGIVAATGAVLAGCEQPPPGITAFSGTNSVRADALCWGFEGDVDAEACAADAGTSSGDRPTLTIRPGNFVGISVDKSVAEEGWVPLLDGQAVWGEPIKETYFRFYPGTVGQEGVPLKVLAGSRTGLRGLWEVNVVN